MAAENQPLHLAADLFRTLCRNAVKDGRVHRSLQAMARATLPDLVSFACTINVHFSFRIELENHTVLVVITSAFGDRRIKYVQVRYRRKPETSAKSFGVDRYYVNTSAMLQDIFTRIRELAVSDGH